MDDVRKQIAEKFRSEGKGEARKIFGDKERDLQEISSEAYRKAQEIKGKADAEAKRKAEAQRKADAEAKRKADARRKADEKAADESKDQS